MKKLHNILIISILLCLAFGQNNYSLEDLNPTSPEFGNYVGTSYFPNHVTLHYFGHYG